MYEPEVNNRTESLETLPLDVRNKFAELRSQIVARTVLPWGEHCTECVWPSCYTTCELYTPRADGACRQFEGGAVRIDHAQGMNGYVVKIRFKQWAKLWTVGNVRLEPLSKADQQERFHIAVGAIARNLPAPRAIKSRVLTKINYVRRTHAESARPDSQRPDCFLLECFNPNDRSISLTLTIRLREVNGHRPFQSVIHAAPGYNRAKISYAEIAKAVNLDNPFEVEIVPNDCDQKVLYFGLIDFVKEAPSRQPAAEEPVSKPIKCIVWDLDNTLWDGTLVEDGPEKIRLRMEAVQIIKQLDERGVLHSIASKNNYEDAYKVLCKHGLQDYFLFPQISWQPKSKSIAEIAQSLNIGIDAMAFVDDQVFEREEVRSAHPQVKLVDAADYPQIPALPGCNGPCTEESRTRRLMYREQMSRQSVLETYQGDYLAFLRDCRIEMKMSRLDENNLKRVYELAQRTNQLNFSGHRYQEAQLEEIRKAKHRETYVIECSDRFGKYGIVGFGVVDVSVPRLLDLMFSCRIQGKRVEHAVLAYLLKRFVAETNRDFFADYRKTAKNTPGGKVFEAMGFEVAGQDADGVLSLVFRRGKEIADDQIMRITADFDSPAPTPADTECATLQDCAGSKEGLR